MSYLLTGEHFNHNMKQHTAQNGFAMLFTVLIVSIILSLAVGIASITFKQNLLSSIAKDSQVAFFAADSGVECALYNDLIYNSAYYPRGTDPSLVPPNLAFPCPGMTFAIDLSSSANSYFVYKEIPADPKKPCRVIAFDKRAVGMNKIQSRGYSVCDNSPRQVERALEVQFQY